MLLLMMMLLLLLLLPEGEVATALAAYSHRHHVTHRHLDRHRHGYRKL